jgi:hypothetical protein
MIRSIPFRGDQDGQVQSSGRNSVALDRDGGRSSVPQGDTGAPPVTHATTGP